MTFQSKSRTHQSSPDNKMYDVPRVECHRTGRARNGDLFPNVQISSRCRSTERRRNQSGREIENENEKQTGRRLETIGHAKESDRSSDRRQRESNNQHLDAGREKIKYSSMETKQRNKTTCSKCLVSVKDRVSRPSSNRHNKATRAEDMMSIEASTEDSDHDLPTSERMYDPHTRDRGIDRYSRERRTFSESQEQVEGSSSRLRYTGIDRQRSTKTEQFIPDTNQISDYLKQERQELDKMTFESKSRTHQTARDVRRYASPRVERHRTERARHEDLFPNVQISSRCRSTERRRNGREIENKKETGRRLETIVHDKESDRSSDQRQRESTNQHLVAGREKRECSSLERDQTTSSKWPVSVKDNVSRSSSIRHNKATRGEDKMSIETSTENSDHDLPASERSIDRYRRERRTFSESQEQVTGSRSLRRHTGIDVHKGSSSRRRHTGIEVNDLRITTYARERSILKRGGAHRVVSSDDNNVIEHTEQHRLDAHKSRRSSTKRRYDDTEMFENHQTHSSHKQCKTVTGNMEIRSINSRTEYLKKTSMTSMKSIKTVKNLTTEKVSTSFAKVSPNARATSTVTNCFLELLNRRKPENDFDSSTDSDSLFEDPPRTSHKSISCTFTSVYGNTVNFELNNTDDDDTDDNYGYSYDNMACPTNLNKNAISAFEEYGVQHRQDPKVEVVKKSGPEHSPRFSACASLAGQEVCREEGRSKHEAKIKAAERALHLLSIQSPVSNGVVAVTKNDTDDLTANPVPYKDPVSALMEYAQYVKMSVDFKLLAQEGPPHMPIFTYSAQMGTTEYECVKGNSTKDTKKKAACVALNTLKQDGKLQTVFPDTKCTLPPKSSKSKVSLGIPGKNPISVLNEHAQKMCTTLKFESSMSGSPHKPSFKVTAIFNDERFPAVCGPSKKEGQAMACDLVLRELASRGQYYLPTSFSNQIVKTEPAAKLGHHDKIAMMSVRKIEELLLRTPESLVGRKVMAAVVMEDKNKGDFKVVSIGTGNRCVKGSHISDHGVVLHDSHAEILARRGFKRYLYQILNATHADHSLLVRKGSKKWSFKQGISFHLYISTAPCGDGALFTHSDQDNPATSCPGDRHTPVFTNRKTQGLLRAKQENGEGTIPIEADFPGQTYDGILQGGRLRIMSCSDKICQWNVVGIQGALLSTFYEPVYLKSITLGSLFNPNHLSRAVCCRVDYSATLLTNQLPAGYHVNHPDLGVVTLKDTGRAVERARPLGINWCYGDAEPEITDGTLGMTTKTVSSAMGASRLCKQALLRLYKSHGRVKVDDVTYKQLKLQADDYNQTKMSLQRRLHEQGYGNWISMPTEVDRF